MQLNNLLTCRLALALLVSAAVLAVIVPGAVFAEQLSILTQPFEMRDELIQQEN